MSTLVNTKNLKGNKVYTKGLIDSCIALQQENEGFIIPKAQRGLSPKFEFKEIMLEGTFFDLNDFYIQKGLLYNLQVLTVLKTAKSQEQSSLGDGFQRLSTTTFISLLNYREAIHAKNKELIEKLEAALFRSQIMRDPGKTYIIQIENKQHSRYLNTALKFFFEILDEEVENDSYESISGKVKNKGLKFSKKYEAKFTKNNPISANPYGLTLLKVAEMFEVGGKLHSYFTKKTAKNFGGGDFQVDIELFNYLSHIEFTFSIPPEEIELNRLFERINTPATVLQQYDIVKNHIASLSELDENEAEIDNVMAEFEDKVDSLTQSEQAKPKYRLNFVEIALHSLRGEDQLGVVMTSSPGQVKDTVLSYFRQECLKEDFSLLEFVKLMNSLAETELILKGKRFNNTVPSIVSSIAFILNKTSKMRDRFSIPLLLLAKKALEDSSITKNSIDKIVYFFAIYRVLRSEPIKGLNPEKGTEAFFSECAIYIKHSKNPYKKIWAAADKKDNLLCEVDLFLKKIDTWIFDFTKKNDKELLAVITWVFAYHFENISLTDKDILNYEIDHTIPLSHIKEKVTMKQTGVSQNKDLKAFIVKEYFSKFFNFIFIHKKFNNHLADISLESRNEAYRNHSPFVFQKEFFGILAKDKIETTNDISFLNDKRAEKANNMLSEAFFPKNKK